jgi:hypothetical protein
MASPRITRVKARKTTADTHEMPSMRRLFAKYRALLPDEARLIDPFARNCEWAHPFTNDLNPDTLAEDHLDAEMYLDAITQVYDNFDLAILDPPFSDRQAGELYGTPNLYASDSAKMTAIGYKLGNLIKPGGYIIKAGYNSNPFHPGFECVEIRMVYHGGTANDTVFSVWQKMDGDLREWMTTE